MLGELTLQEGTAVPMGDGIWVVQQDDEYGVCQNIVLTRADLEALLAAS